VARLGLRIKAKRYDWSGQEPFKVSDLIEAVPVPKGCAGASSPPGWSRALFQRQGPLAWLNSGDDGKSDAGGDDSSEAKSATASSTSQALKPLPFGTGAGCGSGGGLGCLVPCPLGEVDELLAVAQVQALARSWESVYELAQQAFALAQVMWWWLGLFALCQCSCVTLRLVSYRFVIGLERGEWSMVLVSLVSL